jgi:hypothetical protein
MVMILRIEDIIGSGAYSDVFRPSNDMLVYKLFISGKHDTNTSQGGFDRPEDDERRRKTFQSECAAYDRAASHPFLRLHIPGSFRRSRIKDVTDCDESVAQFYILDHCYAMEYLEGAPVKLRSAESQPEHIKSAVSLFQGFGIHHISDASVFFPSDPARFIFIDFAIEGYAVLPTKAHDS